MAPNMAMLSSDYVETSWDIPIVNPTNVEVCETKTKRRNPGWDSVGYAYYQDKQQKNFLELKIKKAFEGAISKGFTNSCTLLVDLPDTARITDPTGKMQSGKAVLKIFDSSNAMQLREFYRLPGFDDKRAQQLSELTRDGRMEEFLSQMLEVIDYEPRSKTASKLIQQLKSKDQLMKGDLVGLALRFPKVGKKLVHERIIPPVTILVQEAFLYWKCRQMFLHELSMFHKLAGTSIKQFFPRFIAHAQVLDLKCTESKGRYGFTLMHPALLMEYVEGIPVLCANLYRHTSDILSPAMELSAAPRSKTRAQSYRVSELSDLCNGLVSAVNAPSQIQLEYTDLRPENVIIVRSSVDNKLGARFVDVGALQPLRRDNDHEPSVLICTDADKENHDCQQYICSWYGRRTCYAVSINEHSDINPGMEYLALDFVRRLIIKEGQGVNHIDTLTTKRFVLLDTREDTLRCQILLESAYAMFHSSAAHTDYSVRPDFLRYTGSIIQYAINSAPHDRRWAYAIQLLRYFLEPSATIDCLDRPIFNIVQRFEAIFAALHSTHTPDEIVDRERLECFEPSQVSTSSTDTSDSEGSDDEDHFWDDIMEDNFEDEFALDYVNQVQYVPSAAVIDYINNHSNIFTASTEVTLGSKFNAEDLMARYESLKVVASLHSGK